MKHLGRELLSSLKIVAPLVAMSWLVSASFEGETRREIGRRDNWTCQHPGCGRGLRGGYMVTAAHHAFPVDLHGKGDDDPECGRILCVIHHAAEELQRGNQRGAASQLATGVYTHECAAVLGQNYFPDVLLLMRCGAGGLIRATEIKEDWRKTSKVR